MQVPVAVIVTVFFLVVLVTVNVDRMLVIFLFSALWYFVKVTVTVDSVDVACEEVVVCLKVEELMGVEEVDDTLLDFDDVIYWS